jgi:hypothetical protein
MEHARGREGYVYSGSLDTTSGASTVQHEDMNKGVPMGPSGTSMPTEASARIIHFRTRN